MNQHIGKWSLDGAAVGVWLAAMSNWLPPIAAALSIVWLLIQIGDWCLRKWRKR